MTLDEYKNVLDNIKPFTNYVYLHLMGEPLLHPQINEIIKMSNENKIFVNITTNGYLIKNIKNNRGVRQLNISLHSFNGSYNKTLEQYINDIFDTIDTLHDTIVNYRLWTNSPYYDQIISILENKYNTKIIVNDNGNYKLENNKYISIKKEFKWPTTTLTSVKNREEGTCRALRDHIGILVNQDVVACCLDSNGDIKFGNLKDTSLKDIIATPKFIEMKNNLENNIKTEKLCLNCNFYEN